MPISLPALPYAYDALEPAIDKATVEFHHDKHHAAYVAGYNTAEGKLKESAEKGDFGAVKHWTRELAFHGAGAALHALYWENLGPAGGGEADGALAARIAQDFGSFENFKKLFTAATVAVEASGWGVLAWDPHAGRLQVMVAEKHQDLGIWGATPLLVCDVWEHAYYLRYQNLRAKYVEAWWSKVNWQDVSARYATVAPASAAA